MTPESQSPEPPEELTLSAVLAGDQTPRQRLFAHLRRYFISGLLVTMPIVLSLYLTWLLIRFFDNRVLPLFPEQLNPGRILPAALEPYGIPGVGLVVVVSLLVLTGWIANRAAGRWALNVGDRLMNRLPVVRGMYSAFKQIVETLLAKQSEAFREVALFEYPRLGIWSLGFVTGTTRGMVQDLTTSELVSVFMPTTPNPTSGYLLFVPREDLIILDMSVDDAMKMIISAAIVTPQSHKKVKDSP